MCSSDIKGMEKLIASFLRKDHRVSYVAGMLDVPEAMVREVAKKEKIDSV